MWRKGEGEGYSEHGFLGCKFGYLCHEFVSLFGREYAVEPCGAFVEHAADCALESTGGSADRFCHGEGVLREVLE